MPPLWCIEDVDPGDLPMTLTPSEAREAFQLIRGVFSSQKFTPKEEGRYLDILRRASTKDVALDAVDRVWRDGDRWLNPKALIDALNVEHQRAASAAPFSWQQEDWHGVPRCCSGRFDQEAFVHQWHQHFTQEIRASAKHLAEDGAQPWARWVAAAEAS